MRLYSIITDRCSPALADLTSYVRLHGRERFSVTIGEWRLSAEDSHGITTLCLYRGDVRRVIWHCRTDDGVTLNRMIDASMKIMCPVIDVTPERSL